MRYNIFALLLILMLAVAGAGCATQSVQPPQDAMNAANVTADQMFPALNSGEYVVFTQNFSPVMKAAVNESYFNKMIGQMSSQYGRYVSRSPTPQASVVGDYNVFVYQCQFEKTKLNVQLTMNKTDVWKVEGFFYR